MRILVLSALFILAYSSTAPAISTARTDDRDGESCTDWCTPKGSKVLKDVSSMVKQAAVFNQECAKTDPPKPGNLSWCRTKCMGSGGLKSKIMGRLKDVETFLKAREPECEKLRGDLIKNGCHLSKDWNNNENMTCTN